MSLGLSEQPISCSIFRARLGFSGGSATAESWKTCGLSGRSRSPVLQNVLKKNEMAVSRLSIWNSSSSPNPGVTMVFFGGTLEQSWFLGFHLQVNMNPHTKSTILPQRKELSPANFDAVLCSDTPKSIIHWFNPSCWHCRWLLSGNLTSLCTM